LRSQTTKDEVAQAYLYEGRVLHSHKDLQQDLPGWMRALIEPITADIKKIRTDVADIAKIKTDIQTINANVKDVKSTLSNLQRDMHIIKVQAAKATNRQLLDGRAISYDEVPALGGKRLNEVALEPILSVEHLQGIGLDDMKKYYRFYYPEQRVGNRSLRSLREDVRIAIGCMVPIPGQE